MNRVERWQKIGRSIRHGALAQLSVADHELLDRWLEEGHTEEALRLLEVLRPLYRDMCAILLQWSLEIADTLRTKVGTEGEAPVTLEAHRLWSDVIRGDELPEQTEAAAILFDVLAPKAASRGEERNAVCASVHAEPAAAHDEVVRRVRRGDRGGAAAAFKVYIRQVRAIHDVLCQYLWVYPSVICTHHGQ